MLPKPALLSGIFDVHPMKPAVPRTCGSGQGRPDGPGLRGPPVPATQVQANGGQAAHRWAVFSSHSNSYYDVPSIDISSFSEQETSMECQVRDITMFYEEAGVGRPLLLLHGWPLDHRHIANDMEPLFTNRSGWRRLYPDLPGMGKTPAANWITNQDQMLELVVGFMNNIAPGERFVVGGTSYGGYLARGLVYRLGAQMDGLLLNVPVIETDDTKIKLPQPLLVREDSAFLAALTPDEQDMRGFIVMQSMDLLTEFRKVFSPAGAIADQAFLQRLHQQYAFSFDVDVLPRPFPAPALFLTGRHDNWCGYREAYQLLDNYPRASFAVLDGAGHALAVEQKTLFRALVNEWLDRVEEYVHTAN